MEITEETKRSDIFQEYGEIADIMEAFGASHDEGSPLRRKVVMGITLKRSTRTRALRLNDFIESLNGAIARHRSSFEQA